MESTKPKVVKDRREYHRAYYLARKEEHAKQMKKWYDENKDHVSKRGARWYSLNKSEIHIRRRERFETPSNRMRRLLYDAKRRAKENNLKFEESIILKFESSPPDRCSCCGILLDYSLGRGGIVADAAPSFDKIIPEDGYVDGNVAVICYRCNRLKSNASIRDVETILAYMRRHLLRNAPFTKYVIQPSSAN